MGASGGWSGEAMVTSTSLSVRHWGRVIEAMMAICSAVNIPAVDIDEASESLASWAGLYRKGAAEDAGDPDSKGGDGNIDTDNC
jgi:hypothetical protein